MNQEALRILIANMTPQERGELAKKMAVPLRCGGCDYDPDGSRFYWSGGRRLPEAEFLALAVPRSGT